MSVAEKCRKLLEVFRKQHDEVVSKGGKVPNLVELSANFMTETAKAAFREIEALEERIAKLEQTPLKFVGTHERERMYKENELVVHDGSLWIALRTTQQTPGLGDGWQLCAKRGRDAR